MNAEAMEGMVVFIDNREGMYASAFSRGYVDEAPHVNICTCLTDLVYRPNHSNL